MKYLPGLVLLALVTGMATAQVKSTGPSAEGDCFEKAQTQLELNGCAESSYKKAEAELETVYQAVLRRAAADSEATERIMAAQKAWLTFRDAQMDAFHPHYDEEGSVRPMCFAQEKELLTRQRIEVLKQMMVQEGDVCGPWFHRKK